MYYQRGTPWMKGERHMNKATKQNTEWEPWDKVAIFNTCPQPELIEEALEEAPDGVE